MTISHLVLLINKENLVGIIYPNYHSIMKFVEKLTYGDELNIVFVPVDSLLQEDFMYFKTILASSATVSIDQFKSKQDFDVELQSLLQEIEILEVEEYDE